MREIGFVGMMWHLELVVIKPIRFVCGPQQKHKHQENCSELPSKIWDQHAPYARAQPANELYVGNVVILEGWKFNEGVRERKEGAGSRPCTRKKESPTRRRRKAQQISGKRRKGTAAKRR
jgi:hypothetical protein